MAPSAVPAASPAASRAAGDRRPRQAVRRGRDAVVGARALLGRRHGSGEGVADLLGLLASLGELVGQAADLLCRPSGPPWPPAAGSGPCARRGCRAPCGAGPSTRLPRTMPPMSPAAAAPPAMIGVLAFWAAEPMVSVTALTAPLALLPFDELDERDLGADRALDLAVRERFAFEAARLRGRGLAADDALGDRRLGGRRRPLGGTRALAGTRAATLGLCGTATGGTRIRGHDGTLLLGGCAGVVPGRRLRILRAQRRR